MEMFGLSKSITTELTFNAKYFGVGAGFVAYRFEFATQNADSLYPFVPASNMNWAQEGFASQEAVQGYLDGRYSGFRANSELTLVRPGLLETAAKLGLSRAFAQFDKRAGYRGAGIIASPFTALTQNEARVEDIVRLDCTAEMAFDMNEEPLPLAIVFDYANAWMDNERYDLDVALTILRANPRVTFLDPDTGEPCKGSIYAIPGPGRGPAVGEARTHCLLFAYSPTADEVRALWELQQKMGDSRFPAQTKYEAIFEMDLLGLRAGGAARSTSFWGPSSWEP